MIKNIDNIVAQNVGELEWILKEFAKEAVTLEDNGELTITTLEKLAGKTIKSIIQIVLIMMSSFLSNIDRGEINRICPCRKKMGISKRNVTTRILSILGEVLVTRDMFFCRRCHKGAGVLDKELEIYGEHRITKGMTEIITYMSQLVPSFERASEAIKKLLSIEVNPTQAQIISEEVGKRVFEKEKIKAEAAYEKPELAAPQEVPKNPNFLHFFHNLFYLFCATQFLIFKACILLFQKVLKDFRTNCDRTVQKLTFCSTPYIIIVI